MELLAIIAFYLGVIFALISVHESGHYLAGWLVGIPARDMRVRLFCFPQHVVLRKGDTWVSPTDDKYVELVWQYLRTTPKVYLYVAGGLLFETLVTTSAGIALLLTGWPKLAFVIAGLSLLMALPWLFIDAIMAWRGRIYGDLSGLWLLARLPTALLVVLFLTTRGLVIWFAA